MRVRFIAHAGFQIQTQSTSVMVDPWFFSSNLDNPVIYGLLPPARTIDFQLPECKDKIESFKPDAILYSHFHTHHSPLREAKILIANSLSQRVLLGLPSVSNVNRQKILAALGESASKVDLMPLDDSGTIEFSVGDIRILGFRHTWNDHATWLVETPTGSFMHVADARINSDPFSRKIDPLWDKFKDLSPDLFVFSAAGHCLKRTLDGQPWILEHGTMSPTEAARLVQLIRPKTAAAMGIFQHSLWTDGLEYSMDTDFIEKEFAWAMNYLDPNVKCLLLRPGQEFESQNCNFTRFNFRKALDLKLTEQIQV